MGLKKKKLWIVFTICIVISLIPAVKVEGEITDNAVKASEDEITTPCVVSSRGAVEYNEPIYEAPKPYADTENYTLAWADEENLSIKISHEDFKLLCHTVFCESGNQSEEAQTKVARVILFRMIDDRFPNTVKEVIYQDNGTQFNVVRWKGFPEAYPYPDTTEIACFKAICEYPFEDRDMLFFRSGYYFPNYTRYCNYGDMYFSLAN